MKPTFKQFLKQHNRQPEYKLYVDLDGVLADFEGGVKRAIGVYPTELDRSDLWKQIYQTPDFFTNLGWHPGGRELWQQIARLHPTVLTGLPGTKHDPQTSVEGERQKRAWVAKMLGKYVPCIVVPSKDKQQYATPESILIDDRPDNIAQWKARGGIGILHTSLQTTCRQLRELGLL